MFTFPTGYVKDRPLFFSGDEASFKKWLPSYFRGVSLPTLELKLSDNVRGKIGDEFEALCVVTIGYPTGINKGVVLLYIVTKIDGIKSYRCINVQQLTSGADFAYFVNGDRFIIKEASGPRILVDLYIPAIAVP